MILAEAEAMMRKKELLILQLKSRNDASNCHPQIYLLALLELRCNLKIRSKLGKRISELWPTGEFSLIYEL